MKKNGFTLIELLAVIVILAIIALIATPIILGIINDARKESNERSTELYASAVRNAIASYQLTHPNAPATFDDLDVQFDGEVECAKEELYSDGSFFITECTVNGDAVDYTYGTKQVIKGKMSSVCKSISVQTEGIYTAGDKYECDVDPNKEGYDYTFYVLTSATSGSVNLIMDSNINMSGDAVKAEVNDLGEVAWYDASLDNSYGPITAIEYLQSATSTWINVNSQIINTFTVCDGDSKSCEEKSMTQYIVNARMPYFSEISDYSEDANNAYLYNNLNTECLDDEGSETSCDEATEKYGVFEEGITHKSGIYGYWTLSSFYNSDSAWLVYYKGYTYDGEDRINIYTNRGVRPVINLSI